MREVQGERLAAEQELGDTRPAEQLTLDQVRAMVRGVQDAVAMLRTADPRLKAQVYAELGIEVTYHPGEARAMVSALCSTECVGGGT